MGKSGTEPQPNIISGKTQQQRETPNAVRIRSSGRFWLELSKVSSLVQYQREPFGRREG